ncbi:hypothetical protein WOLCODRAFT_84272 [Wolfiporia cocos MD-104 SS10]|uniref:Clp1-like protein n=1 Tax=Wolfiporia cocos (strain MD-104) TaxID=742152 RepID=A0A2H3JN90_WOLCO|nr:hypothetical protein WOLCODRAFT_84272 [Wolfiporia cocos MD-104 SS10]
MAHHHAQAAPPSLQLPRNLARPSFSEVSRQTIAALEPELATVPIEYITGHLAGQANQMIEALSLLTYPTSLPRARMPPSIDVPLRPVPHAPSSSVFPTHMLAISSSKSSPSAPNTPTAASFYNGAGSNASVPLYPAHALVLAAHCTLLPALPVSRPSNRTASLHLPVVPLTVPNGETFPMLHEYLHTKRPDVLLAALLPHVPLPGPHHAAASASAGKLVYVKQFTSESLLRLAHQLVANAFAQGGQQGAPGWLMARAKVINGLWRNVCALGVFDAELWGVMDVAWEVVLAALTRVVEHA